MRKFILGIIVLFIAISIPVGAYIVQNQRTENRSKAGGLVQPTVSSALELPLVEFGVIAKINGIGYQPEKILAQKPSSVLGETTETTPSATPVCQKTESGDSMCPQWSPVSSDFCKDGIITQGKTDACGCIGPPDCSYPITSPPPGCTYQEVGSELGIVCQTPTATITSYPTPTNPPSQPARYIFKTFDGRTYVLQQPQFHCDGPPGTSCPQIMPAELNFDQYLNTPIMIEGILKRSKCTYAPEVTDYRCDVLQNSPDQNYPNFWPIPLPKDGIFEARTVHTAQPLQKDQLPSQPISGILSISQDKYANENIYMLPDYKECAPPVCGPKFVRSATVNLAALLNTVVQVDGRFYYVDGAVFIDVTSVNNSSPTPQPTCIPFPKECINPPPVNPNAELDFCTAIWQDVHSGRGNYCQIPCTPLSQVIIDCMSGGKSLDDCTATMGTGYLPWCKPTPPIPQPECNVKPEGASCCASNCPAGATCIQSCAEGTCKDRVCMPSKPEFYCQGKKDGTYCSPGGYCQNQKCVPVPPTCTFQQIKCIKAPCDPILICPTPTKPISQCQNQPDGSFCTGGSGCGGCKTDQNGLTMCPACAQFAGYCQKGICIPGPTPTPYQDMCNNQPEGSSCTISDCPVCDPQSGPCSLRPCRLVQGICNNRTCVSSPTPTPPSQCANQPNGSQCWISGFCPPPPPCTPPGPCATQACAVNPGICQNGTCISTPTPTTKPRAYCDGAPDGVTCTRNICKPRKIFGGFGNFLPRECYPLPGICQSNTCIEPPGPTSVACMPADINMDGNVDPADLNILLGNFFKIESIDAEINKDYIRSDINKDGIVDISDYSLLVQSFGKSSGPCI